MDHQNAGLPAGSGQQARRLGIDLVGDVRLFLGLVHSGIGRRIHQQIGALDKALDGGGIADIGLGPGITLDRPALRQRQPQHLRAKLAIRTGDDDPRHQPAPEVWPRRWP